MKTIKLSVVLPAFNEERRIGSTLDGIHNYLRAQNFEFEIVLVDDGSRDDTVQIAESWAHDTDVLRILKLPHRGKGFAVKEGMLRARGNLRLMCDVDMSMPVEYIERFVDKMSEGYDVVIGSREVDGSVIIGEPLHRHMMGRIFNQYVRMMLISDFRDTQCGFKCFTDEAADKLFRLQRIKGWGFDVEILIAARAQNMKVLEMPLEWHHDPDTKVRLFSSALEMIKDMLMIKYRSLMGRYKQAP